MIAPWRNPRSRETWWFRRRVPARYRNYGLPAEIKFSLDEADHGRAAVLCAEINLELEREWRTMLDGIPPTDLTHRQIVALAGKYYASMIAAHEDEPGRAIDWQIALDKLQRRKRPLFGPQAIHLRCAFGEEARAFLRTMEVHLVGDRFDLFVKAFVDAKEEASKLLKRRAAGDYSKDDKVGNYPELELPDPKKSFDVLWAEFCRAKGLAESTKKKWEPYFAALIARIGTRDMARVTEDHLLEWRDALLSTIPSPITVKDGYIAAMKAFFGWCKRGKKLPTDPSADVVVEFNASKHAAEMRGFTDEEADTILSAALAPMSPLMSAENAAARRWVPWICAYTGARVNEITQLRACDIQVEKGIDCIYITPEAGSVKTCKARKVPLHPHLLEQGFLEFALRKTGKAPLFYSSSRKDSEDRSNPTYKSVGNKLGEWVRSLGIKDPSVAPNHGWRYRFKTEGLQADMKHVLLDIIQGHAPSTEGAKYIIGTAVLLNPEIVKYPRYDVVAGERRDGRALRYSKDRSADVGAAQS